MINWGWLGGIPKEQKEYYYTTYSKLYPTNTKEENYAILAKYFLLIMMRNKFKFNGAKDEWDGKFIQISHAGLIPGTPPSLVSTRLFYRTMPANVCKHHMPAWRCKGYVKACGSISLNSWLADARYKKNQLKLEKDGHEVVIAADELTV